MSEAYPWYGLANGDRLEQGDFLMACPLVRPTATNEFLRHSANVIILSQSCDLAHDKLEIVQVCPVWPLERMAEESPFFRSKRGREELRRGNLPGYQLLNRCDLVGHELDYLVCDFRSLFGTHVAAKALAAAQSPRVRLLPPYREHVAQAFARFFMRVGLPVDVPPFE